MERREKKNVTIECPECGKNIPLSDTAYNLIVTQVCNKEIEDRILALKEEMQITLQEKEKIIRAEEKQNYELELERARTHFVDIKSKAATQIASLESELKSSEKEKQIALSELEHAYKMELEQKNTKIVELSEKKDNQIAALKAKLVTAEADNQATIMTIENNYKVKLEQEKVNHAEQEKKAIKEIAILKASLGSAEKDMQMAISTAVADKDKQIAELSKENSILQEKVKSQEKAALNERAKLKAELENEKKDSLLSLAEEKNEAAESLRKKIDELEAMNRFKDGQIASLKDFKAKLSTKMLGETLEIHCERMYDTYLKPVLKNSSFIKDTGAGEKGDYIYREDNGHGEEILSILFDMKNEDPESPSRKKKNADHFEKLNRDRERRKCQVAVLVSTLEPDNDLYNAGISVVSEYERMFVIRPQNFVTFLHLMRAVAADKVKIEEQLELERNKNIDLSNFEGLLAEYKEQTVKSNLMAKTHADDIVKQIDKFIDALEKHKEKIIAWQKQCELVEKKAEGVSIKSLVKDNETMKKLFEKEKKEDEVVA